MRDRAQQSWPQLSNTRVGRLGGEALDVRVGEDDVGALAAELEADLLHVAGGRSHDLLARGRLAGEGDLADAGVRGDSLPDAWRPGR